MIKVKLITMGRLKEKYLTAACDEYKKRLSAYCNFEICEIEPQKLPDKPSESQIEKALEKEAEQIKAKSGNVPDNLRFKVQKSVQKIADDGKEYFICIII